MNRGKRAKATSSTAPVKQTPQPLRQPVKAPLSKPAPPSPPKPTPSQLLRKEWQTFELWFSARREEKDKRISERTKQILSSNARNRFQKPADSQEILRLQVQLNQELADQARAEWLRRLSIAGLNEEDWTDMTQQEMDAIVSVFEPQQPQEIPTNGYGGASAPAAVSPSVAAEQQWRGGIPGAWDPPSFTAASTKAPNGKTAPAQAIPNRTTQTPILSDSRAKQNVSSMGMPTADLLWEMHMGSKASPGTTTTPSLSRPFPAQASATTNGRTLFTPSAAPPSKSAPTDSPWQAQKNAANPPPMQTRTPSQSLWDMQMSKANPEHSPIQPEVPWNAHTSKTAPPPPPAATSLPHSKSSSTLQDGGESLWNMFAGRKPPSSEELPPAPPVQIAVPQDHLWRTQSARTESSGVFGQLPKVMGSVVDTADSLWNAGHGSAKLASKPSPTPAFDHTPAPSAESLWSMRMGVQGSGKDNASSSALTQKQNGNGGVFGASSSSWGNDDDGSWDPEDDEMSMSTAAPSLLAQAPRANGIKLDPSESMWGARMAGKPNSQTAPVPVFDQKPKANGANGTQRGMPESLWDTHMTPSTESRDTTLSSTSSGITSSDESSPRYVYLSPVLIELEDDLQPEPDLLPEKTIETSIRQFHQTAADADIELWRKLIHDKDKVHMQQLDQLLDEHLQAMEARCRAITDEWKEQREAEKQKRAAAEEKKRLAEAERQRKLAEAQARKGGKGKGKWNVPAPPAPVVPTPPPVKTPAPAPPPKKAQPKPIPMQKGRGHKVTVEEVDEDAEQTQSDAASVSVGRTRSDSLSTNAEDPRLGNARPGKTPTSNFLASMWGKNAGSRSSSPVPAAPWAAEERKPAIPAKKAIPAAAPPDPLMQRIQESMRPRGGSVATNGWRQRSGSTATQDPWASPNEHLEVENFGQPEVHHGTPWDSHFEQTPSSGRPQAQSLWGQRFMPPPTGDDFEEEEEEGEFEDDGPSLWETPSAAPRGGDAASAWGFAMNAIGGGGGAAQRATSPPTVKAPAPRAAFGFTGGSPEAMWMPGGDDVFRGVSRGAVADERPGQSQFATWVPPSAQAETRDPGAQGTRRKMMEDLALQNLYDTVASPEEESEPTELLNAMSMYTKAAVANKGKKKGGRR